MYINISQFVIESAEMKYHRNLNVKIVSLEGKMGKHLDVTRLFKTFAPGN